MSKLRHIASLMLISALLTACGGGGSSASAQPEATPPIIDDPSSDPTIDPPGTVAHAQVYWSAPTAREDGSALMPEEIAGYEVYHLDASGEMDIIEVDSGATEYELPLVAGTHELSIAAVDVYGVKSRLSDLQTIEVN